jgi:hypothetical protein
VVVVPDDIDAVFAEVQQHSRASDLVSTSVLLHINLCLSRSLYDPPCRHLPVRGGSAGIMCQRSENFFVGFPFPFSLFVFLLLFSVPFLLWSQGAYRKSLGVVPNNMKIVFAEIWQHMQACNLVSISFGFLISLAFSCVTIVPFPRRILSKESTGTHVLLTLSSMRSVL